MSNWRITFSENPNGLSVENFICRVKALTVQTLQGDFDLLCRNVSSLFEAKAADWFCRWHGSVSRGSWTDLCITLNSCFRTSPANMPVAYRNHLLWGRKFLDWKKFWLKMTWGNHYYGLFSFKISYFHCYYSKFRERGLFLGVDFWNLFNFLPRGLALNDYMSDNSSFIGEMAPKVRMSDEKRQQLDRVASLFPAITMQGFGYSQN